MYTINVIFFISLGESYNLADMMYTMNNTIHKKKQHIVVIILILNNIENRISEELHQIYI